jgi:hypothetical protein
MIRLKRERPGGINCEMHDERRVRCVYQEILDCEAGAYNYPMGGAGMPYCIPDAPQHKDTQRPNNAVKLVCSNVSSYLRERLGSSDQLFFSFRS